MFPSSVLSDVLAMRVACLGLALVCVTSGVQAAALCQASSIRDAGSILVRDVEGTESPAVRIVQGETLCLEATPDGDRLRLRVVKSSMSAIRVALRYRQGRSALEITNPGPFPLWYDTLWTARGQQPVPPGSTSRVSWKGWDGGVTLHQFRVEPPPVPMRRGEGVVERRGGPRSFIESRPFWMGLSAIISVHHNQQDALDAEFRSNGYTEIETNQPIAGFAFDLGWARWRFTWDIGCWLPRSYTRISDRQRYDVEQCLIALYGGWDIVQHGGFAFFPLLGIGLSDLRVSYDPANPPMLRDELTRFPDDSEVRRNLGVVAALLGVEQRLPLGSGVGLLFGMRIGFAQQFVQDDWVHEDPNLPAIEGGPRVDTSGPFYRVGLGIVASSR